jgi:hypothetical protein
MVHDTEYKNVKIGSEIYDEARQYCDDNGIRFIDFIEDALENAVYETQELNFRKIENIEEIRTKPSLTRNRSGKYSPTKMHIENKVKFPNHIIFIQCGSFFEVYDDDALTCSEIFGWKTFNRGEFRVAGIPTTKKTYLVQNLTEMRKAYIFIEQHKDEKDLENQIKRVITDIFPQNEMNRKEVRA